MEYDQDRPYSVLTRDDLIENMEKQIHDISEIFCLSKSDATVLLMYFRWDSLRVSERLVENKDKLLTESGLKSALIHPRIPDSSSYCGDEFYEFVDDSDNDDDHHHDVTDSFCGICIKTCDDIDDDELISTPFCSHKFCSTCFREYLVKNFYSLKKIQNVIPCPDQDCQAAVGLDTIEKLTIRDKEMYERYVLRTYLEENKVLMIKLCPAPDCNYAIEFHESDDDDEYSLNVVCLCGHTFCWRCMLESHRPVTCNNASDWLSRDLKNLEVEESVELLSLETNTKRCPKCHGVAAMDGTRNRQFLTCTACRLCFCSKCLQSKEIHMTPLGFFGACFETPELGEKDEVETSSVDSRDEVEISCLDSWKESEILIEEAKNDLQDFDKHIIKKPSILKEQDIRIIREGLMLIIQCRQVLKWSCVYDYFHTEYEISKKVYLRYLQEKATATLYGYLKTLLEETEGAFSASTYEEIYNFRHKLPTATSNIGNYFYHFIKTLQDGLVDVKVKSYDDVAGPYWFCDRCTYGNTWLSKECQMCCYATATSSEDSTDCSFN